MDIEIKREVLSRLERDFAFKPKRGADGAVWMRGGTCPTCNKKEMYTNQEHPWVLRCGRLQKCGTEIHVKELYADLFENWSNRFKKSPESPNAAADAYLKTARGFDLNKIKGWYSQENYFDHDKNIGSSTVRFALGGNDYWERIIDQPQRFGKKKAHFNFGAKYHGTVWTPPSMPQAVEEIWIVEGIFDAIALMHVRIWAVAAMSCNNYPALWLSSLKEQYKVNGLKLPKLIWALDGDSAGRTYAKRWNERAKTDDWSTCVAIIPQKGKAKRDWNDMFQHGHLQEKDIKEYFYHGSLLTAESANEKALLMYNKQGNSHFHFDFDNRLYWFEFDIEAYRKALDAMDRDGTADGMSEKERRDRALQASNTVRSIANCNPTALYYQANTLTDESWYYLRVDFPHDGKSFKNTFTGGQLSSASEFKKRLLAIAPGAVYMGNAQHLDYWLQRQLYEIKTVQTIDFIGFAKDEQKEGKALTGTYVFNNIAVRDGKTYEINEEDFFDIGKLSIKSLNQSVSLAINSDIKDYSSDWVKPLWTAFKAKGIVALAFWLGSLFAEQIRHQQKSFPFLEVVGDPGAGKSTLIEFMWKLFGRRDYEGFDPSKSTLAARARNFAQVANLPIVLIESDRDSGNDSVKQKGFDWDELKTAYNGRSVRSTGVKNGGNDTREPPFRGSIVISQNATVSASDAMLQRICHIGLEAGGHTPATKNAAESLERMPVEQVSGFILRAAMAETKIMETFRDRSTFHEKALVARPDVKSVRLAKNHAQIMAMVDALSLLVPLDQEQIDLVQDELICMTVERQLAINADHPMVQEFWDVFDYIESDDPDTPILNHSRNEDEIAINLNHLVQVATDRRQQLPEINALKKLLRTSRFRKFIDVKPVNSSIHAHYNANKSQGTPAKSSTVKCWVFKRA